MSTEKEISEEVLSLQKCLNYSIMLNVMPAYPEIKESNAYKKFNKNMWDALIPVFLQLKKDLMEEGIELEE